jgi:hypothetical protein
MIIWFALLIPILLTIGATLITKSKVPVIAYALPLAISLILITVCKGCSETIQTRDTEYWGSYVEKASYYEDWDERVSCRHPRYRTETRTRTVTDSKGKSSTETYTVQVHDGYYHSYDVDYHAPYWEAIDSQGHAINISKDTWEYYTSIFQNKTFKDMHRDYHSDDGDAYETEWNGKFETVQPVTMTHIYENRVQASNSVFNYKELRDREKVGLYEYADKGVLNTPSVLPSGIPGEEDLEKMNALLGEKKQVRVWMLVFNNQPREISKRQEAFWKGGNKNELVICVGTNNGRDIAWAEVFSWTKREDLKVSVRDYLQSQKTLDIKSFTPWLTKEIESKWERRQFKEFSYLTVEPTPWAIGITFVLTLIASVVSLVYITIASPYQN